MNPDTGQIRNIKKLTSEQFDKFVELRKEELEKLAPMNRQERRDYAKEHGLKNTPPAGTTKAQAHRPQSRG